MKIAKRILALAMAGLMLAAFAACGDDDVEQPSLTTAEDVSDIEDDVKIVVPLDSIDEEYQDDLDAYAEHYGYSSAKLNKLKKTVTITMGAFQHKGLLARIGMKIIGNIYDFEDDDKTYPYLVSIDEINEDDFSSATITVKSKAYKEAGSILPYMIGQDLTLYQYYLGETYDVTVTVKNTKGKVIDTITCSAEDV